MGKKDQPPATVKVLDQRISAYAKQIRHPYPLVRETFTLNLLACAIHRDSSAPAPPFVIKGGVGLQNRTVIYRATKDLDLIYTSAQFADWQSQLTSALDKEYMGFKFEIKGPPHQPSKDSETQRIKIKITYNTRSWATQQVDISPAEVSQRLTAEAISAALVPLDIFGFAKTKLLPTACLAYCIGQKLHACTERFPQGDNERIRDIADILLMKQLLTDQDWVALPLACKEIFNIRQKQDWPPIVQQYPNWASQYESIAAEINEQLNDSSQLEKLPADLDSALLEITEFIKQISQA